MSAVKVYTKPLCPHCVHLKEALRSASIEFEEVAVGRDIEVPALLEKFPEAKSVPILAVGNHRIGGLEELQTLIQNDQLRFLEN